MLRPRPSAE